MTSRRAIRLASATGILDDRFARVHLEVYACTPEDVRKVTSCGRRRTSLCSLRFSCLRDTIDKGKMMRPATLDVQGLTKRYGKAVVVDGLSFEVPPGRVTGFLGPNGAGKSTTLRMLLGLVRPSAGTSTIAGREYAQLQNRAQVVGALLDTEQFHPGRSGRNHLRALTAASGVPDSRVDEVLAEVELLNAADKKVGAYSLGMRQRLGIAAALLGDPQVLILDEPANGLDPAGMRWLRLFLRRLAEQGRTVLVSSHQLGEVAQMADDVVVIAGGRLVAQKSVADLTKDERSLEDVFFELTGHQETRA